MILILYTIEHKNITEETTGESTACATNDHETERSETTQLGMHIV